MPYWHIYNIVCFLNYVNVNAVQNENKTGMITNLLHTKVVYSLHRGGLNASSCVLLFLLHTKVVPTSSIPPGGGGWWRWALLSPDGVAPSWMVGVSASVSLPWHHKVQKFSSGTGSPGWSRKKGRKMLVCVCVCV